MDEVKLDLAEVLKIDFKSYTCTEEGVDDVILDLTQVL